MKKKQNRISKVFFVPVRPWMCRLVQPTPRTMSGGVVIPKKRRVGWLTVIQEPALSRSARGSDFVVLFAF